MEFNSINNEIISLEGQLADTAGLINPKTLDKDFKGDPNATEKTKKAVKAAYEIGKQISVLVNKRNKALADLLPELKEPVFVPETSDQQPKSVEQPITEEVENTEATNSKDETIVEE